MTWKQRHWLIGGLIVAILPVLVVLSACTEAVVEGRKSESVATCDWPVEAYDSYNHPLLGAALVDGKVPGVDVHDSPTGRRYALVTGAMQDEGKPAETWSRVEELEWDWLTPTELAAKQIPNDAPIVTPHTAVVKRSARLDRLLAEADPDDLFDISVSIAHENNGGLVRQMMRSIGEGRVTTFAEYEQERVRLLDRRATQVREAVKPVRLAVEAMGGDVRPATHQFRMSITIPASKVATVEALPEISTIGMEDFPIEPASYQNRVRVGGQVNEYVNPPDPLTPVFDGHDRSGFPPVPLWTVGFGEETAPDDEHPGFRDGVSGNPFNWLRMFRRECDNVSCWTLSNFPEADEHPHPSACLGLVLGDLQDGQDPTITNPTTREARSGYAPEAWGRVYKLNGGSSWYRLLDDAISSSPPTPIINSSNGGALDDCLGRSQLDQQLSGAFEDGTLVFWAGGNRCGHDQDPPTCTVEGPKGPGVVKVGTFGALHGETAHQIRTAPISPGTQPQGGLPCNPDPTLPLGTWGSPRGGVSWAAGRYRTIIDFVGYGNYSTMFDGAGGYNFQSIGGATSQSTATVTGMAADLVHWFRTNKGYLPSPGQLRTLLLLMGDRQNEGDGKMTRGFNNLWGAGRLKMRRLDEAGLDAPWGWAIGETCVYNGTGVYVNLGLIPSSADIVKAVVYWYDRRTAYAPPVGVEVPDDIDLRLQSKYLFDDTWTTVESSIEPYEPRERVFAVPLILRSYRLHIAGFHVTADDVGCGTNGMKVYYAYLWEDSARDDSDGPGSEIDPE